ncbi:MAG: acyl-ACP--UDP-N-acetylglucosamine O-acyltransferase [Phycisphaera sp.]|nr:acyl-ACP--UDP-N-acetylglucosamine O-acyltransferase [Phycisphaera sp.]
MPDIHPSSVVEDGARLGGGVSVGPFCYVARDVSLGEGTRLVSHVSVVGNTTVGKRNVIWPNAVIGGQPQDLKHQGEPTSLVIGDDNDIREGVTMHVGTVNGGGVTRVGSGCLIMVGCHVAHDCHVGDHAILANAVGLSGHVRVEDHARIGGQVGIHHFVTVGQFSFVGGLCRILQDVPPFMIVDGTPARVRGVNTVGLTRNGFDPQSIENLKRCYRILFRDQQPEAQSVGNLSDNLAEVEDRFRGDECVAILTQFLRNKLIGVFGRYEEAHRDDDRFHSPGAKQAQG